MEHFKILQRISAFNLALLFLLFASISGLLVLRNTQHYFFKGDELSEPLAFVSHVGTDTARKTYDSLNWSRLKPNTVVRNGDFLRTEDTELMLYPGNEKAGIKLAPHSLIRLSSWRGTLQLDIREGDAIVEPGFTQPLEIKKNKSSELLPVANEKEEQLEKVKPTPTPAAKIRSKDLVIKSVQLYPKRDSIILFKEGAALTVSLPFECKTQCLVTVKYKDEIIKEISHRGFPIQVPIGLSKRKQGEYNWTVESAEVHERGSFEAHEYSKPELQRYILQDKDIDIVK